MAVYNALVLPPVLEIYVLWHPDDREGEQIATWLREHFHGAPYAGLVGGAVEVYSRSVPWHDNAEAPRPLPIQENLSHGLPAALVTAVVPVIGVGLARAVARPNPGWNDYLESIMGSVGSSNDKRVGVFPVRLDGQLDGPIEHILGKIQALDPESKSSPSVLCRELAQGIAQLVGDPFGDRLNVFISHTKRHSPDEDPNRVDDLVRRVREVIGSTHLSGYFDAADLQPGSNWEDQLVQNASGSALLAVRTDLYAGREWCQREFLVAKQNGMPIVTLNAVVGADHRGSFLMDHVPMAGYDWHDQASQERSIEAALNVLVDGALRRAVWNLQVPHLRALGFDWAPLNAPEPTTMIPWLLENRDAATQDGRILIMHPDPPLGPDETEIITKLSALAGVDGAIDVVTPRTFASRGGGAT